MVSIKHSSNYIVLFIHSQFPNGRMYHKVSNSDSGKSRLLASSQHEDPGELYVSEISLPQAPVGQFRMGLILPQFTHLPWTCSAPEGVDLFILISSWFRALYLFYKDFLLPSPLPPMSSPPSPSPPPPPLPSPLDIGTPNPRGPKHALFSVPRSLGKEFPNQDLLQNLLGGTYLKKKKKKFSDFTQSNWSLSSCKRYNKRIAWNNVFTYLFTYSFNIYFLMENVWCAWFCGRCWRPRCE